LIKTRFGDPAVTKDCFGTEVYIYNRKEDTAFRNHINIIMNPYYSSEQVGG